MLSVAAPKFGVEKFADKMHKNWVRM